MQTEGTSRGNVGGTRKPALLSLNNYNYRRGGSDAVFLEHDDLFRGMGWQTAVMAMHHPKNLESRWSEFFVDEIELGHSYSAARTALNACNVIYSFEAAKRLNRLLGQFRPDVAHVHCIYHHLSPSVLWTLRKAGIPIVLTAHDLKILCPAYKMLNSGGICERCKDHSVWNVARYKCVHNSRAVSMLVGAEAAVHKALKTYRRTVDMVVAPSEFFVRKFLEWGWPEERIRLVRNCVDVPEDPAVSKVGSYFLYFGRLAVEKGVSTLMRAASMAGMRLVIAGTGPEEENLKRLAGELPGTIEFLGFLGGEPLRRAVLGARAVVVPSEWYENNPMAVLEAFSLGKPVIGARIGGIPELVRDGTTGLLFDSGDVQQLARALLATTSMDDDTLTNLGENGRALVRSEFSRARYVETMLEIYRSIGVAC